MRPLLFLPLAFALVACGGKCPVCGKAPASSEETYANKGILNTTGTTYVCPDGHKWSR